jgi:hypothetical protein
VINALCAAFRIKKRVFLADRPFSSYVKRGTQDHFRRNHFLAGAVGPINIKSGIVDLKGHFPFDQNTQTV